MRNLRGLGAMIRVVGAVALVLAGGPYRSARAQVQPGGAPPSLQPPQSPGALEPVARDEGAAPDAERRAFGLLLHVGPYSGFGGGVALGTRDVGLRASVGWTPLLLVISGANSDLNLYSSLQVSPDVYVRLLRPRPTTDLGGQLGYRYSSLLGHGLAFGGYAQFAVGRAVDATVSLGFLVYPEGEGRLKREENLSSGTQFSFPGPSVSFAVSLGLAFFP